MNEEGRPISWYVGELEPVTITLPPRHAPITRSVIGEIVTPELAVTPAIDQDNRFDGRFTVTHIPTGYSLVPKAGCITCARKAARVAAESALDWTRDNDAIKGDPAAVGVVATVKAIFADCGTGVCP